MCYCDIMERKDSNTYMTNYVRLCYVAQYENRKLLEELLYQKIAPREVYRKLIYGNNELRYSFKTEAKELIRECSEIQSFANLDLHVIYLVLRNLNLVDPPYHGWYHTPRTAVNTIGDCVDLIQQAYNVIFHSGKTSFTDEEVRELFSLFKDIARVFERSLNKNEAELVVRYINLESCCVDNQMCFKYIEDLRLLESRLLERNSTLTFDKQNALKVLQKEEVLFTSTINPMKILPHLTSMSDLSKKEIICEQNNKGERIATSYLLKRIRQQDRCLIEFIRVLRYPEICKTDLADMLDPTNLVVTEPIFHPNINETDSFQLSPEVTHTMRVIHAIQVVLAEGFRMCIASLLSPEEFRLKTLENWQLYHSLPKNLKDSIYFRRQQGYEYFSLSLIQKLLSKRFICDQYLAEYIRKIMNTRKQIIFRGNACLTDIEMEQTFLILKQIAQNLENMLKLPTGKLMSKLEYCKTCCMDDHLYKWYHERLKDLAEREHKFETSRHLPNSDWMTRYWYLPHRSVKTILEVTPYDPASQYILIGYAFEETLSKILQKLLSHIVPHCLLFTELFGAHHPIYFNAEEYLLIFESQKNGYLDFDTMLLSSVMLCLKKTQDDYFWETIQETKHELLKREKKELTEIEMMQYFSYFKDVATKVEQILQSPKGKFVSLFEKLENLLMEGEQLKVLLESLVRKALKQQKPIWMEKESVVQKPSSPLLDSKEFYELLVDGFYISYENRVYLGGPCNAGKTSLACILTISMLCHTVHGKVISAINEMRKKDKATKTLVEMDDKKENDDFKLDDFFHNLELKEMDKNEKQDLKQIARNTDSQSDIKEKLDITKRNFMQTPKLDNNAIGESKMSDAKEVKTSKTSNENSDTYVNKNVEENTNSKLSKARSHIPEPSTKTLNVIQEEALHKSILDEVRRGEYNLEIAPSDLVDFGGQKAFDMTHQLFILQEGTVLLLFDGSKDLDEPLPDYHGKNISSADILMHWVNSVSTYCTEDSGMQMIHFVATHSDKYQDNFEIRRKELVTQLTATFQEHEKRSYLSLDNLFFIDARNKDDNEIDKLKDGLVQIAFSQTSWGQKMPLIWVPLEKQIVDLKLRGTSILGIEEIQKLNKLNEDLMMDDEKLHFFLRTQHAIGKLVFFDQDELSKFVIIDPSVLVNALRSFITDEMFFPSKDTECYHILKKLQMDGMLKKNDLMKLWNQDEFQSIFRNQDYKDFIAKILLRLDVLVEPTLRNQGVNFSPDFYIVPCMIQTRLGNDYAEKYLNENRSICMAYVFKVQMVPPCVFFRLIASAVGIWPLKKYQEQTMFFQDIATFVFDENNEFSLIMEGRKIVVYFTNANSIHKIQPPKVASVQECLSKAIKSITEFYQLHSRSIDAINMTMFEKPFELEYGAACEPPCFVKREEELRLSKTGMWKFKHGQSHEADYLWYWDSKKNKKNTPKRFTMADISPIVLMEKPPADLLRKLSFAVGIDGDRLGLKLGVESSVIKNMVISNRYDIFEKTLKIFDYWKKFGDSVTVKHLVEGLQAIGGRGLETIVEYYRFKHPVKRCRSNSIPSLRSPLENIKEGKDWFYKLKISCDMYDIHLIIDRALETKYKSLAETVNQKDMLTSLTEKLKCSKPFKSVFEKIYHLTICTNSTSSDENLCEQNELLFRFDLARNLCPFKVINLLRQSMEDQMHKLCKAFSWYLLRRMIKETSISDFFSQVKDIWPGFFCKCNERKKGHSAICSKEPVIVIDADEYLEGLPEEIYGIPVKQSAYYLATDTQESDTFIEDYSSCEEMSTVSGENAQELFLLHTKLTLVYKSITQPWCVRLCCQAKGIIPMGEKHLPIKVYNMNTKIMQGNVSFLHKMHVGCKIGPETKTSWGTLGGFVQRRGEDAFLTCSHVVYDRKTLLCGNKRTKNKEKVEVRCYSNDASSNDFVCGYVVDDVFEYDKIDKTSIDAAVVVLDRSKSSIDEKEIVQIIESGRNPTPKPVEFLGMTSSYINDNYKTRIIEKGEMKARLLGARSGYFERNVKYEDYDADKNTFVDGLEHGVVPQWADLGEQLNKVKESNPKPLLVATDVHLQTTLIPKLDEMTKHDRHSVRFYHQLLMENFPFENGDSGTCIYITEDKTVMRADNQPNPTGCIGMAIASYNDIRDKSRKIIVTPMKAILEALGLI